MTTKKRELIKSLANRLSLADDIYAIDTIKEKMELIEDNQCLDFYQSVVSKNTFGNGLKAFLDTIEEFNSIKTDNLLAGTREQAKAMYDKFYYESYSMLDYARDNRDKVPNDREFFINMPYSELKRTDGSDTYTKQELYVLEQLGSGSWLIDIRYYTNSKTIVDRIETIISNAKISKYENTKQISNGKVMKMIAGMNK